MMNILRVTAAIALCLCLSEVSNAQDLSTKTWLGIGGVVGATALGIAGFSAHQTSTVQTNTGGTNCVSNGSGSSATITACTSTTPTLVTSTTVQHRATDWKLVGPAIGLGVASGLFFKFGPLKHAGLKIEPRKIQFVYNWGR